MTSKDTNFLLHKVGKYWYVSQQLPIVNKDKKNKEYRHKHFGRIIKNSALNNDDWQVDAFEPFMEVFCLSGEKLKNLKVFIDKNFKNIRWKIPFDFIKNGIEVNANTVVSENVKEKVLEKELA